jgi:hypothetical protein
MSAPDRYLAGRPPVPVAEQPWVIVTGLGTDADGRDVVSVYAVHRITGEVREGVRVVPDYSTIEDALADLSAEFGAMTAQEE